MSSVHETCLIGVDGGATSCRFALCSDGSRHEVTLGSANATSDFSGTIATLKDGLGRLSDLSGISLNDLAECNAYLGLAGVMSQSCGDEIAASLPLHYVVVEDDRRTAVAGALGDLDGAVVGLGTGSFFARQHDGRTEFVGGWGAVLGDEASGSWLGRKLLARVLWTVDGRADPSILTKEVLERFGDRPSELVAYAAKASPAQFAEFAPLVSDAAALGDTVALHLLQDGAAHIATALNALGWQPEEPVCFLGGVSSYYEAQLPPSITARRCEPRGSALDGALHLASRKLTGLRLQ